jgi:hypothetical protein
MDLESGIFPNLDGYAIITSEIGMQDAISQ